MSWYIWEDRKYDDAAKSNLWLGKFDGSAGSTSSPSYVSLSLSLCHSLHQGAFLPAHQQQPRRSAWYLMDAISDMLTCWQPTDSRNGDIMRALRRGGDKTQGCAWGCLWYGRHNGTTPTELAQLSKSKRSIKTGRVGSGFSSFTEGCPATSLKKSPLNFNRQPSKLISFATKNWGTKESTFVTHLFIMI